MHDCRMLESRLVDLAFEEFDSDEKQLLLLEVESCADCLSEYRSLTETLSVFDQAVEASLPKESYWSEHQAARCERLEQFAPRAITAQRESLWKRIFAARLPVPVPVAAAIVLGLLFSSVLALRPSTRVATTAMQSQPTVIQAAPQIIEVPVFREKVITHTVYVEKNVREKIEARRKIPALQREGATALVARQAETESVRGGFFTHANLTDFQPAGEMRIRVIKRNNSDEK